MDYQAARNKLFSIGQQQLLAGWDTLDSSQREQLLSNIDALDIVSYRAQRQLVVAPPPQESRRINPLAYYGMSGSASDSTEGWRLLSQGKVGALVVAGGQGTRLGWKGPKGTYPVTVIKHKSLFQLASERIAAAGQRAGCRLPLAIMTSPQNDAETREFFAEHQCFGLDPHQLSFFVQSELPFMGSEGQLFLETPCSIAQGPDGNGAALHRFYSSGIWDQWKAAGIEYITFQPIDNALADPFDAELIGYHTRSCAQITLKATIRASVAEAVGVIVERDGKVCVVEYTELPETDRQAMGPHGLKYPVANLSLFCFSMDFSAELNQTPVDTLPLHLAYKPVQVLASSEKIYAWKCERFIFDVLQKATRVAVLVYPRTECFAPLKNRHGPDSLQEVQQALQNYDKRRIETLIGKPFQFSGPIELDPALYYQTPPATFTPPDQGYIV